MKRKPFNVFNFKVVQAILFILFYHSLFLNQGIGFI